MRSDLAAQPRRGHPTQPPILTVAGNNNEVGSQPLSLCGKGLNFTPGSSVTLTMTNVPGMNGTTMAPKTFGPFTVGADGKFSYSISSFSLPGAVHCTMDQLFADVTVTATNSQQELASNTFNASNFCNNTSSLPGSFGGGCQ